MAGYGQHGKLCYRRYGNEELSPELLQEAQAIVAEAQKAGFDVPREGYRGYMENLRSEVQWLAQALAPKAPAKVPTPLDWSASPRITACPLAAASASWRTGLAPGACWRPDRSATRIAAGSQLSNSTASKPRWR